MLLDRGASVNVVDRWGTMPLLEALQQQDLKTAVMLVEKGAAVKSGTFSLVKTLAEQDPALLRLACERAGCKVDACDYDKRSVLHLLCAAGQLSAAESVLTLGADVNIVDRWISLSHCIHRPQCWQTFLQVDQRADGVERQLRMPSNAETR